MKTLSLKVSILAAVLTTAGLVVAGTSNSETTLNQIAGYRQWTRVNREPVQVNAPTVALASPIGVDVAI